MSVCEAVVVCAGVHGCGLELYSFGASFHGPCMLSPRHRNTEVYCYVGFRGIRLSLVWVSLGIVCVTQIDSDVCECNQALEIFDAEDKVDCCWRIPFGAP